MSLTPLVSIITCFLNQERFLEETILSVLEQKYPNWELILVDDGSTDLSTDIAKRYAKEYPDKIKYLDHYNHQNKGASASRNAGIKISRGELITFLDGDDIWLPTFLDSLVKLMQKHDVAMVSEASKYWYSWDDNNLKKDVIIQVGQDQDQIKYPPQLIFDLYPLGEGSAPCICGLLITKEVLEKHGCFDEYFRGMYDDQALLVKLYLYEKIYISSNCHNLYRQRPGSLVDSSHFHGRYLSERLNFLMWLEKFLKGKNVHNTLIQTYFDRAIYPYKHPTLYKLNGRLRDIMFRIKEISKNILRHVKLYE